MATGPGVRLAVFDCDGTLVDSQASIIACVQAAWQTEGLQPPVAESIRRGVGLSLGEAISLLAPGQPTDVLARLTDAYKAEFRRMHVDEAVAEPLFPGIASLLDALEADGWLLGVATGKSRVGLEHTLEVHGLLERFVTLQTADVAAGKPSPDMLHRAMADTGALAADVVMIGDTTYDIVMAVNAGVTPVGVAWGYHPVRELRDAGALAVVENSEELRELAVRHARREL